MLNRTRKHSLILYLNDDEKYILDTKYKLSGMRSRMAFLRHLIIYGYVYDVDYKELHDYNVNLSRIGNSLNQIAKRMNATGHVYDEDVKEVKEIMKQVWHTQKSMLSKQPCIRQQPTSAPRIKPMAGCWFPPMDAARRLPILTLSLPCQRLPGVTKTRHII